MNLIEVKNLKKYFTKKSGLIKKEIKEKMFDDFWTAYPHARK